MTTISNFDDTINSRDVIARIEELEGEREALDDARDQASEDLDNALLDSDGDDTKCTSEYAAHVAARVALAEWDASDAATELATLKALAEEASGYAADWRYGETLIRDSYFRDYAMELADDIGAVPRDLAWPVNCIDWDQAARELQMDYSAVDFDGVTYWVR